MCIYGGKLARDRDVSPVGGENYNLHIHICKYDMHNFLYRFLSLSPKVSSLIVAQQLEGNIFIINYLVLAPVFMHNLQRGHSQDSC